MLRTCTRLRLDLLIVQSAQKLRKPAVLNRYGRRRNRCHRRCYRHRRCRWIGGSYSTRPIDCRHLRHSLPGTRRSHIWFSRQRAEDVCRTRRRCILFGGCPGTAVAFVLDHSICAHNHSLAPHVRCRIIVDNQKVYLTPCCRIPSIPLQSKYKVLRILLTTSRSVVSSLRHQHRTVVLHRVLFGLYCRTPHVPLTDRSL
jgi:hypothetical protein